MWARFEFFMAVCIFFGNLRTAEDGDIGQRLRCMIDVIDDPYLNYFALDLLLFVIIMTLYAIIVIHDIPAKIAESRHHPHADAIDAAGGASQPVQCCG
jgi:hypothetical protein